MQFRSRLLLHDQMNEMKKYNKSNEFKFWYLANKKVSSTLHEKYIN